MQLETAQLPGHVHGVKESMYGLIVVLHEARCGIACGAAMLRSWQPAKSFVHAAAQAASFMARCSLRGFSQAMHADVQGIGQEISKAALDKFRRQ